MRSVKAETLHKPAGCALSLELSHVAALGEGARRNGTCVAWPLWALLRPPAHGRRVSRRSDTWTQRQALLWWGV